MQLVAKEMSCIKIIKEQGLRLTPQRRIIIDAIHDASHELTAESIISTVQEKMPEVNKSTVYRNLDFLEKAGCVFKSEVDNHTVYHHAEGHHHCHLICKGCGKIIECDEELFEDLAGKLFQTHGFHPQLQHMVVEGYCKECSEKIK